MMAVNTIILKGGNHQIEVTLDAIASPGMAIELAADGKYDPVASAQAEALKQGIQPILIEDGLQGKTVDDAYASGVIHAVAGGFALGVLAVLGPRIGNSHLLENQEILDLEILG